MPSKIKNEKRKSEKEGRRKSERKNSRLMCDFYKERAKCDENCAAVITYTKRFCQGRVKNHRRYQASISNQTTTGNFLLLCMPVLWTVFSLYFASKTEGREVHDLQSAFWKLNQLF